MYVFTGLEPGSYVVAEVVPAGWQQTSTPLAPQDTPTPTAGSGAAGLIRLDALRADPRFEGLLGASYASVIIDTGIDLDHPFFGPDSDGNGVADRIVYQYDFLDGDNNASDLDGHGTNVAGIVASQNAAYPGVAPGADIIVLRVLSEEGKGNFSNVEKALKWVVQNTSTYNIVSVNLSLGDQENHTTPQTLYGIDDELSQLASNRVIVVAASGNDFYEFNSAQGVYYPAADPNAISVGAVFASGSGRQSYENDDGSPSAIAYTSGPDRIAPFSQRDASLTTVFAPGADHLGRLGRKHGHAARHQPGGRLRVGHRRDCSGTGAATPRTPAVDHRIRPVAAQHGDDRSRRRRRRRQRDQHRARLSPGRRVCLGRAHPHHGQSARQTRRPPRKRSGDRRRRFRKLPGRARHGAGFCRSAAPRRASGRGRRPVVRRRGRARRDADPRRRCFLVGPNARIDPVRQSPAPAARPPRWPRRLPSAASNGSTGP